MNKLILFSLLLIGNFSWAAAHSDDDPGAPTAAKAFADGKNDCKCDQKAETTDGEWTKEEKKPEAQKHTATVFGKDGGTGSTGAVQEGSG